MGRHLYKLFVLCIILFAVLCASGFLLQAQKVYIYEASANFDSLMRMYSLGIRMKTAAVWCGLIALAYNEEAWNLLMRYVPDAISK